MSQKNLLKADILKILSNDISGGRRGDTKPIIPGIMTDKNPDSRPTFENAQKPTTFFGGKNQPYYALAQEPHPAASAMSPIIPGIIRDKNPSKRKTYKSAEQPNINGGTKEKCAKANQDVVKFCAKAKKPKSKRAPSAYNMFIKKYFAENKSATMTAAAAAWKLSKSPKKPSGPKPPIKITSFGEVPPPPPTTAPPKKASAKKAPPKKRKLKIVEPKKPAAANYASGRKIWAEAGNKKADFDEATTLVKMILNGEGERAGATSSTLLDDMIRLKIFQTLEFDAEDYKTFGEMDDYEYEKINFPDGTSPSYKNFVEDNGSVDRFDTLEDVIDDSAHRIIKWGKYADEPKTEFFDRISLDKYKSQQDSVVKRIEKLARTTTPPYTVITEGIDYAAVYAAPDIDAAMKKAQEESFKANKEKSKKPAKKKKAAPKPTKKNLKKLFKKSDFYEPSNMNFKEELFKIMLKEGRLTGKDSNGEVNSLTRPENLLKKDGTFKLKRTERLFSDLVKRIEDAAEETIIDQIMMMNTGINESAAEKYKRSIATGLGANAREIVNYGRNVFDWPYNIKSYDDYTPAWAKRGKKPSATKSGGADTHVMPDGTIHTGKTHTKDSRVVKAGNQLMSSRGKMESKSRKNSTWLTHLAEFRKNNPSVKAKDVFREAKKTYTKSPKKSGGAHCGGELELIQESSSAEPIHEAGQATAPKVDIHQIDVEKDKKPPPPTNIDARMVQTIMTDRKAGNVPEAPEKAPDKPEKDQNKIMVDIMNSYDEFNKRFEQISNSSSTIDNKRSQYESERTRIEQYHDSIIRNYSNVLSVDKMKLEERAYFYALETFKIGLQSLIGGEPQQRVDFENFDDNETITEIIDKELEFPRGPLDRATSFYSVPIKDAQIQSFNPVVPKLGKSATIYPYGRQMAQKEIIGGKVSKSPKQLIKELTRDMFIRDMMRIFPNKSKKQIIDAYEKNKNDIRSIVTDVIVEMIGMRGGAECGADQYKSGDKCYNKQSRMKDFDRDTFMAQKRAADAREKKDDGMVERPQANMMARPTNDMISTRVSNPLPNPKPQTKREDDFAEKFTKAVTPSDSGPFFNTDGSDISDPKAWADTLGNIFVGTAKGVETIFSALADLF